MIVQWCIKGMSLASDSDATELITNRGGIVCNWWRDVSTITPAGRRDKLTAENLDRHVNHFDSPSKPSGRPFCELTPFISLTCGTVERDSYARTNHFHRAVHTALWFGTRFGTRGTAYLYTCWVVLAPRPSTGIESVAEEVRDLNVYRRYSAFQTEGEVVAKVNVPSNQIQRCEKWTWDRTGGGMFTCEWTFDNADFVAPEQLSNVRELI